jgi:transposase InsO family protein
VLRRIRARLEQQYGPGAVKPPGRTSGYLALSELDRGRSIFSGSTKSKRSIANRPAAPYGHLTATRPGEYVLLDTTPLNLLDTTPLNVFALSPVTGRWVPADLTIAIDLYSRCILGMRLTPGSTKSIDVSGVLVEACQPFQSPKQWGPGGVWPYHGVPENVLVDPEKTRVERFSRAGVLPETIVVDHGKPYLSEHVTSACARLGISIQPARIYQPTDKSPVERFFRTLDTLLQQLPGYKGPDVASRGEDAEGEAVYTIPQLEEIIREWTAKIYHQRPHSSLSDPRLPGVKLSPAQRYEQGQAIAGTLKLPVDRNALLELLPVVMRHFNHYGVEIHGLRFNGPIVAKYRNRSRSLTRKWGRKWPFHIDPGDLSRIYFFDPDDRRWHVLESGLRAIADGPFSLDALEYAKKIAAAQIAPAPVEEILAELLEAWGAGLAHTPEERRISARQAAQMAAADPTPDPDGTWSLRTVQARLDAAATPPELADELTGVVPDPRKKTPQPPGGDDDDEDELYEPVFATRIELEPMELM